jgi:Ca2+-binding RTX toxin-like protein
MQSQTFKDLLCASGPDKPRTPCRSREARLAEVAPPIVAELLERRRLFALTITTTGGVLSVTGTSAAENILVYKSNLNTDIYVDLNGGTGSGGTTYGPYSASLITGGQVWVYGGDGNDIITLYRGGNFNLQYAGRLYGQGGSDDLSGGSLGDVLYGGDGGSPNDTLRGFEGNDSLYGESGGDTLEGGAGGDYLYGGGDNDSLDGGADNDWLEGQDGTDTLRGGTETDSMYGGAGDDLFWAEDTSYDFLDGGDGTDCLGSSDPGDDVFNIEG